MVLVIVGTKIIDKALSLMTIGELAKATTAWRQDHFGAVMSEFAALSCSGSDKNEMRREQNVPLKRVTLWRCGSSDWMMSKVWFAPHRRSLFCHLAPSMCRPIPVSGDTARGLMSSQNRYSVPSCQWQWYLQLLMGNYVLVPQEHQSAYAT